MRSIWKLIRFLYFITAADFFVYKDGVQGVAKLGKTAAKIANSSSVQFWERAQAAVDIKVTSSQEFIIIISALLLCRNSGKVIYSGKFRFIQTGRLVKYNV